MALIMFSGSHVKLFNLRQSTNKESSKWAKVNPVGLRVLVHAVKGLERWLCCEHLMFLQKQGFCPQCPHNNLQPFITSVPEDVVPSLASASTRQAYDTQAYLKSNAHTHRNKNLIYKSELQISTYRNKKDSSSALC